MAVGAAPEGNAVGNRRHLQRPQGARCITCAGGTAAIDLMLARIAAGHGHALAAQVSEQFLLGRIRSPSDHHPPHDSKHRLRATHTSVQRLLSL